MPTLHFLGRVLPEAVNLTVHHRVTTKWSAPEHDLLSLEFAVKIDNSAIDVTCISDKYSRERHLVELRMRSEDLCKTSVNLCAFATGMGLRIILDRVIEPNGTELRLIVRNPKLEELCTAFNMNDTSFNDVHLLVLKNIHLNFILHDLIAAMNTSHMMNVNCGRVIDGIKNQISPNANSDGAAWRAMRVALNIDEAYLKYISSLSKDARHGKLPILPTVDGEKLIYRTWTIMDRYITYLKLGGSEPLSANDFPLLTG